MKNRKHQKRHRVTATGFVPMARPEQARAMQEHRASSAADRHDSRPRRQRSRQDARRAAIQGAW